MRHRQAGRFRCREQFLLWQGKQASLGAKIQPDKVEIFVSDLKGFGLDVFAL